MSEEKPRCCARLVLGSHLAQTWANCKFRLEGRCCKDCEYISTCANPCSKLYEYYNHEKNTYDFTGFKCLYFCTKWEGIFKRLDTDVGRGLKE